MAATKVAAPGSLTKDEALGLLLDLSASYGTQEFQAKLEELYLRFFAAAPGKERNKLNVERSKLFLEVQGKVLPQYGFSGDARGVFQMWQAMQPHMTDGSWQRAVGMQNAVCRQDVNGAPLDPLRPSQAARPPPGTGEPTEGGGSFCFGESRVSRFPALTSLDGLFPCSCFQPFPHLTPAGDLLVGCVFDTLLALTLELDIRWRWKLEGGLVHCATLGSRAYATSNTGSTHCFCLETGSEVWRRQLSPNASAPRSAATYAGGGLYLVCCCVDGQEPPFPNGVMALSLADGSTMWRSLLAPGTLDQSAPQVALDRVVVRDILGTVSCLQLATGSLLWQDLGCNTEGLQDSLQEVKYAISEPAVSAKAAITSVCRVPTGKKSWNKPYGGRGLVVTFDLKSGRKLWEQAFDLEAHVSPIILAEKRLVVACLGNKCGPLDSKKENDGDTWPGMIVGLSIRDGDRLWSWEPPVWRHHAGMGCEGLEYAYYSAQPWTSPVADADGNLFTIFHSGTMYIVDTSTGEGKQGYDNPFCSDNSRPVLLGDHFMVIQCLTRIRVFRWPQPGPTIAQPLALPFEETGTDHFHPSKIIRNDHTLTTTYAAPEDLSTPAWSFESPCGNRRFPLLSNNWYCNPIVDSQRNVYNVTELGWLYVHRSDGTLRGSLYIGMRATTPVIDGTTLYSCNADGYIVAVNIETLEVIWSTRYAHISAPDTWMPGLGSKTLLVAGVWLREGIPQPVIDPEGVGVVKSPHADFNMYDKNFHVFGHDRETGAFKWTFAPDWMVYNFNPTFVRYPQYSESEFAIIIDNIGGVYLVNCDDGTCAWKRPCTNFGTFHDICGVTMGPNRVIYFGTQDATSPRLAEDHGKFPQQACIYEAFDTSVVPFEKKWEAKFPYAGMLQSVVAPAGDGKFVLVLPMGENGVMPEPVEDAPRRVWTFQGIIYGLDPDTGEELWSFTPPPWKSETSSCKASTWWSCYLPASWCSPVVDGRGTLFIYWHGGIMYSLEAATGRVKSSYDMGCCVTGCVGLAPGLLVAQAQYRVLVWRDSALEDAWLEKAAADGDPRAKVGRVGCGIAEEAKRHGIAWGMNRFAKPPPDASLPAPPQDMDELRAKLQARPDEKTQAAAAAAPADGRPHYVVVGGAKSGGISVRKGALLKSEELPSRLATGAEILELEVSGDRVSYQKLSGEGPERGWVSKSFKGAALLKLVAS